MYSTSALGLLAFVSVATALQIQSGATTFPPGAVKGCISASSNTVGAPVVIQSCLNSAPNQNWTFTQNSSPQPFKIFGDKCLDVTNGVASDGTKLQIWSCVPFSANQQFTFLTPTTIQWAGHNLCVDLTDGNPNNGNQIQVWTCGSLNTNQQWSVGEPKIENNSGQLRASGKPPGVAPQNCLTASDNLDGGRVSLDACGAPTGSFARGNDTWVFPALGTTGPISTFNGLKCLDVRDGNTANGNLLQVWSCFAGNANQMFAVGGVPGQISLTWAGQNKCVNVKDGNFVAGSADIQIWDCNANDPNQFWAIQ